jgi:hypothetical protein
LTPQQGKDASIYHAVNVGPSSNYDSHVSYIFVAAIAICPPDTSGVLGHAEPDAMPLAALKALECADA